MASASENVFRPLTAFPNGIWDDGFLESNTDSSQMEAYAKEIDILKEQVRAMLMDGSVNHKDKLDWINVVDRLGVSYYFEKEIEDQLECIFQAYDHYGHDYDLYTVSTHFRVFRQHGYNLSCDVFNKFKNSEGRLQDGLKCDMKGILSLYEAAHLAMHGEEFMDEALDQTIDILRSIASDSKLEDQCLYEQIVHATKQPFHTGMKRVETGHFISFYEKDKSRNVTFLRLAKLDFNMLQQLHRQELCQIVKWWNELDVQQQLSYARNRSAESKFWAVGMSFEPCYSRARVFVAKVISIVSLLDDTYDAYGTIEELRLLTQAFERWNKDEISELTSKTKLVFNIVFDLFDEFGKEMENEGRDYAARYAKAGVLDIIRCYYAEANWAHQKYIPSYEEYMSKAARTTSASKILIIAAMLGMEADITNEKGFEWAIDPVSRAIKAVDEIGRLMNDIATHQDEQKRGLHVASAIQCYMKEHGSNEEEAVTAIKKKVRDAWKDMNEDLVKPIQVSPHLLHLPLNLARTNSAHYREMDGYTQSVKAMKTDFVLAYAKTFDV